MRFVDYYKSIVNKIIDNINIKEVENAKIKNEIRC